MSTAASILWDLGIELRDAVLQDLTNAGRDLPERVYVANGDVAFDECEQLSVELERVYVGAPAIEDVNVNRVPVGIQRSVEYQITLTRCVPGPDNGGNPPSVVEIEDSAEALMLDGWALWKGLLTRKSEKTLLAGACSDVSIGALEPHGPEGNQGGWKCLVRVQI